VNIVLENLRYLSESGKELQSNRLSMVWNAYLTLLSFFVLTAGSALAVHFVPSKILKIRIWGAFAILGFSGVVFLVVAQHSSDKVQGKYSAVDRQIIETLINRVGLDSNIQGKFINEKRNDMVGNLGRWAGCFLMGFILTGFTLGSGHLVTMDKNKGNSGKH
jgi:hypothetical protein